MRLFVAICRNVYFCAVRQDTPDHKQAKNMALVTITARCPISNYHLWIEKIFDGINGRFDCHISSQVDENIPQSVINRTVFSFTIPEQFKNEFQHIILTADTTPIKAATPEPQPSPGHVDILPLVVADLEARAEMGKAKYGTVLQAHNGRDALMDAYQEALDLAMYLRQLIEERDK